MQTTEGPDPIMELVSGSSGIEHVEINECTSDEFIAFCAEAEAPISSAGEVLMAPIEQPKQLVQYKNVVSLQVQMPEPPLVFPTHCQSPSHLENICLDSKDVGEFDDDHVNEIFRIMHTIKGASAVMMYQNIATLSHKLEDVFYYIRESQSENIPPNSSCSAAFFKSLSSYIISFRKLIPVCAVHSQI